MKSNALYLLLYVDYNSPEHLYIIILELVLILLIASITFASLALTKIDCNRPANYFLLPVFFAITYFNVAHHYRTMRFQGLDNQIPREVLNSSITSEVETTPSTVDDVGYLSSVSTIKLVLCNGLGLLTIVQLGANLFADKLAKVVN